MAKRHDLSRNLIRIWIEKFEAGECDDEAHAADLLQEHAAKVAALERLVVAALKAAIAQRRPRPGCVHHSDRGSQYASEPHRALLKAHGFVGSMSRRGNPYDNAKSLPPRKRGPKAS